MASQALIRLILLVCVTAVTSNLYIDTAHASNDSSMDTIEKTETDQSKNPNEKETSQTEQIAIESGSTGVQTEPPGNPSGNSESTISVISPDEKTANNIRTTPPGQENTSPRKRTTETLSKNTESVISFESINEHSETNRKDIEIDQETQASPKEMSANIEYQNETEKPISSNVHKHVPSWTRKSAVTSSSEVSVKSIKRRQVENSSGETASTPTKLIEIMTNLTTTPTMKTTMFSNDSTASVSGRTGYNNSSTNMTKPISNEKWHSFITNRFKAKLVALLGLLGIATLGYYIFYSTT